VPQGVGVRVPSSAPYKNLLCIFEILIMLLVPGSIIFLNRLITRTLNITQISTGDLTAAITIQIDSADYKGKVNDELKKQAKKANMPGFRPGKVPVGVVRRMVGKSVVIEQVTQTVSDALSDYIKEEDLKILGDPLPRDMKKEEDFDINCDTDMEFIFDVGLEPEFELNFDLPAKPPLFEIEIDDDFLNEEIKNYQDRFAEVTNPESVAEGDVIYGRLYEVDENGEEVEAGYGKMIGLNPERIENKDIFPPYYGKELEYTVDFELSQLGDDNQKIADLLFVSKEEIDDIQDKKFKFTVKRINRVQMRELGEELYEKVGGSLGWEEEIKDEEAFKARLSEHLKEDMKESARWYFRNETQKLMLETHEMTFPEEFLKRWLAETEKNKDRDNAQAPPRSEEDIKSQIENEFGEFKKSLTWTLIMGKINAENEETNVGPDELREEIKSYLTERFSQMEGQEISDAQMDEYLNYTLQNEELVRMHYRRAADEKLFDFLSEKVAGEEKSISATEFTELIKPKEDE
jgi:trigger factor